MTKREGMPKTKSPKRSTVPVPPIGISGIGIKLLRFLHDREELPDRG
jgi:hypothetical protein